MVVSDERRAAILDGLGTKLHHHLDEIRVRALDNLLSKLASGVVILDQVAVHANIIAALIQWLHRGPSVPRLLEILDLITQLSPLCNLTRFGALQVLQALKCDATHPALQSRIDVALQALLEHGDKGDALQPIIERSMGPPANPPMVPPPIRSQVISSDKDRSVLPAVPGSTIAIRTGVHSNSGPSEILLLDRRPNVWRFPFLSLPRNDERLLFDLSVRLKSKDSILVQDTLMELRRDTVLDFPGEVFLQRPQIILAIVSLVMNSGDIIVDRLTADVLVAIVDALRSSLRLYADPASRPPPSPPPVLDIADSDLEETQYPPRGRQLPSDDNRCEPMSLRCNWSIIYFADLVVDAIVSVCSNSNKLAAYAPALFALTSFCDWTDSRLDALAAGIRVHRSRQPIYALHIVLRISIEVADTVSGLPGDFADALGDALCDDDPPLDSAVRADLFRILSRCEHGDARAFAEANAIVTSLANLNDEHVSAADIDKAVDGIVHNTALLPAVVDSLLSHLPDSPSLMCPLHRLLLHADTQISDFVVGRLTALIHSDNVSEFLADDAMLREIIMDGRPSALAFLAEACASHPSLFAPCLRPYRIVIDMMASGDSSAAGLGLLAAQWLNDEERQASILRNLFHNDAAIVRDARDRLASDVVAELCRRWDVESDRCNDSIANVLCPFQIQPSSDQVPVAAVSFAEADIRNLVAIFANFAQDSMLRTSAAEQLEIMLNSDTVDQRFANTLSGLIDALFEQLYACSLDVAVAAIETAPILLPTLRLLFLSIRTFFRVPDDRLAPGRVNGALLPFVFHADPAVRVRVAEILSVTVFHPRCLKNEDLYGPELSTTACSCTVPVAVPRLFTLPTDRVVFDVSPSNRSSAFLPPNPRVARIVARSLDSNTAADPVTLELIVRNLLERIESAASLNDLLADVGLLHACCVVDNDVKIIFCNLDWSAYFQRYFRVAPVSRDDDFVVFTLLSCALSTGADIASILLAAVFPVVQTRMEHRSPDILLFLVPVLASSCNPSPDLAPKLHRYLAELSDRRHYFRALTRAPLKDVRVDHAADCVAYLSQNRLPSSFDSAAGTRASVMLLCAIMHRDKVDANILIPDPDAPSLRWIWRLITDRESALRAAALHLFAVLDSDLRSVANASAPSGTDMASTATRLACDQTQAPFVRQAALILLCTFDDEESLTAIVALIPALLRADVVVPSFWMAFLHLADRLLQLPYANQVKAHLFQHDAAAVILNLMEPQTLETAWNGYCARHCLQISSPDVWSTVEFPIAVDCAVASLSVLQHVVADVQSNQLVVSGAIRLLAAVTARPDTLPRAEPVLAFLLQLDAAAVLAGFGSKLSLNALKQIAICSATDIGGLCCAASALIIVLCRQMPAVDSHTVDVAGDLLRRLVQLMLAALAKRTYYSDVHRASSSSPSDDADLHAQALAHLASVLPANCKTGLRFDGSLRLLIDHANSLYNVYVARRFANDDASPVVSDLERILIAIKSLLYHCPHDIKVFILEDLHLGKLTFQLWRMDSEDHKAVRQHLLHLILNVIAAFDPAKLVLAGLSKREKRSGILSGLIDIAIAEPTSLVLQCLQSFATCPDTLPVLLRAGVAEAIVRRLRVQKRMKAAPLWVLACMALSNPGQARLTQILVPEALDNVLNARRSAKCITAALTLLHNLSFYGPAKTTIIGNPRTLTILIEAIKTGDERLATLASATMWSLVYDCQKGCAMMRQQLIEKRISLTTLGSSHQDPVKYNLEQTRCLIDSS